MGLGDIWYQHLYTIKYHTYIGYEHQWQKGPACIISISYHRHGRTCKTVYFPLLLHLLSMLCIVMKSFHTVSVSVPPPCYRSGTLGSWSFSHRWGWQVTAEHAYTLRMWLCMKWHGTWLYGVHRTCAEMAAVSHGTIHASAVSTPLWWILKKHAIKS